MKQNFTVFYSWQSDIDAKENRHLINKCIKNAVKNIKKPTSDVQVEVSIDRDTMNKQGSPNIADTIFSKISASDVFICDVTLINNTFLRRFDKNRLTPNPNVLVELGYAINLLGWERIICVNNLKYGRNEDLPFDIRGHRISNYNSRKELKKTEGELTALFEAAIKTIIVNYDEILARSNKSGHITHDRKIYEQINKLCDEGTLRDSLSQAVNSLVTSDFYYSKWDSLEEFFKRSQNHFINEELNIAFGEFLSHLSALETVCATKFFPTKEADNMSLGEEELDEETRARRYRYGPIKHPFPSERWSDADRRNHNLQKELSDLAKNVTDAYQAFTYLVKKNLLAQT